jgi:arsenate reductase-like glutaredoxin family protein
MEERNIEVKEKVSASRKLGAEAARDLIREAATVHVAKGRKLDVFAGGTASDDLVAKLLGATGNLRAPAVTVGDQLVVGFNDEVYRKILG